MAQARKTSYQFKISVKTMYLPEQSAPEQHRYTFAYTITIANTGSIPAQLISRHWVITSEDGEVNEVKGLGVVGQQPLIAPGQGFEYTSGSQVSTPTATMKGSYFFVAEDGERFEQAIPAFVLSVPRTLH
ncbi:MAG: Co2+/Mg2+ efflux protein ApaG [Betaproteobacteria bacterium]|nr:Co2+/Mg2+ efflux protein ApaG [Pseudomonadota bacterium]NBO12833.1 Co2+/Mg2+ efflux protein ApaG [Betaproteobacteria bacterium]NBO45128.1 Co2+/Mg2+ efflux protein ApaG [Betaproteobacteria bacterium]NBP11099.1 Co2+/Mg2+ efflux protein ApaG [Betaproteobacteria bacterium]NBP61553.1 Co2+/Mg2+ efflux protein ApaG [Betaproteobacteria bacterium]